MSNSPDELSFADLKLPAFLLESLKEVGYESPSPIQRACIPLLLQGEDVIGMAQTGTGKTAAFALPILAQLNLRQQAPQALVLCPTRELAIQVAEAFQTYARHIKGFHVLPLYGGQDMRGQLRGLKRGAHVIVGTPGRLLDHLERRSLDLGQITSLVLDEADEMLRMGFIDDVEAILQRTPTSRRVALFSATMPAPIRKVASQYLNKPREVRIETAVTTNENIEQFYWLVSGTNKLDALTRILEVEEFAGMIIFVRTKTSTVELSDKLSARGFAACPLNGDMNQTLRQRTVENLKNGKLDILVATDVAARGLDVDRISHVLNYDVPYDDEAYVHRIGRTGRAGRTGKAILFVAPRERRLLRSIEKTTRKAITQMTLPSQEELLDKRVLQFKQQILESLGQGHTEILHKIIDDLCEEQQISAKEVAVSLATLLQKDRPSLILKPKKKSHQDRAPVEERTFSEERERKKNKRRDHPAKVEMGMLRYKISVGSNDNVKPGDIVGAIANEAEIEGQYIGHIKIHEEYSTVDLPEGMPKEIFQLLQSTRVRSKQLRLQLLTEQKQGRSREKDTTKGRDNKREDTRQPIRKPRKRPAKPGKAHTAKGKQPGKRKSTSTEK